MASRSVEFVIAARDRASATLSRIGTVAQRTGQQVAGAGTGFGRFGTFAGVAATAVGAAGVAAAAMGLRTAASLEQAGIGFETMLGSAEKSKAFLGDLQRFAASTPFEMPGLVAASRQLIGVGQSAQSVIPTLTAWGDTAGALGLNQEQFSRAMTGVTQAMAKGKVSAEELGQITEAGIPIWPLLSRAMGKTVPELQKLSEQGKLLSSDVFPALERQMGEEYGGAMGKQAQTLSGLWSTFKDTLSIGLAGALESVIPKLKDGMPGATRALQGALEGLGSAVSATVTGVSAAVDFYQRFAGVIDPIAAGVTAMAVAFGAYRAVATAAAAAQAVLNAVMMANPIGLIILAIVGLVAALVVAYKRSETFRAIVDAALRAVGTAFEWLKVNGAKALDWIIAAVKRTYEAIVSFRATCQSAMQAIGDFFSDVGSKVKGFFVAAFRIAIMSILTYLGWIVGAAATAFGWMPGIGPKLRTAAAQFETFKRSVNAALGGIKDQTVTVNVRTVYQGGTAYASKVQVFDALGRAHGGGRERGGPVRKDEWYIVGERRAEVFIPNQDGTIYPDAAAMLSGRTPGGRLDLAGEQAAGRTPAAAVHHHYHAHVEAGAILSSPREIVRAIEDAYRRTGAQGSYVPAGV